MPGLYFAGMVMTFGDGATGTGAPEGERSAGVGVSRTTGVRVVAGTVSVDVGTG